MARPSSARRDPTPTARRPKPIYTPQCPHDETRAFVPTDYVDITPVADLKRRAVLAHVSQGGDTIMRDYHEPIASFRGREIRVGAAEAFVRITGRQAVVPLG